MKNKVMIPAALAAAGLLWAGCADQRVTRVEMDHGTSVRTAVIGQILDPAAMDNLAPVEGLDPQASGGALERYHDSFGKEPEAAMSTTINIGR